MCGFCNDWKYVSVGFECVGMCMCGCVYVWVLLYVDVCMCGFCYVWVLLCVGVCMCGFCYM